MDSTEQIERGHGQSSPGLVMPTEALADFGVDFLNAERCCEWLIGRLHGTNKRCPYCDTEVYEKFLSRYLTGERVRCKNCLKQFTAWTGTWMSGSKMDPREVMLLALLVAMDQTTGLIATKLGGSGSSFKPGRSKATVCDWRNRFRVHTRINEITGA